MNPRNCSILAFCLIILASCGNGKPEKNSQAIQGPSGIAFSGKITISGAYALSSMAGKLADNFMKLHQGVKIEIIETGTGEAINELIEKKVDLAMISRPLLDEEKEAGIWVIPVAKDGVAPIVNSNNPYMGRILERGLSPDEFQKVFTADNPVRWSELLDTAGSEKVMVYSRADESGAADMMAKFLFRKATDFKGKKVTGDYAMIKSIQDNPLAIGFCNFSFAFNGPNGERTENIQVIPFDLDFDNKINRKENPFRNLEEAHRSVWLGLYPDLLCRELTFGSLGKPTNPVIIEFLKYVLTDGQEEVKNAGLCKLNNIYVREGLDLLE